MTTAYQFPKGMIIYNVDVGTYNLSNVIFLFISHMCLLLGAVDPVALKKYNPNLPEHRWVMAIEHDNEVSTFLINNGTTLTNGQWIDYKPSDIPPNKTCCWPSACPSVRYAANSGYYYVLTGGYESMFSTTLKKLCFI